MDHGKSDLFDKLPSAKLIFFQIVSSLLQASSCNIIPMMFALDEVEVKPGATVIAKGSTQDEDDEYPPEN